METAMRIAALVMALAIASPALADTPVPAPNPLRVQDLPPPPPPSASLCGPRADIVAVLRQRWQEVQVSMGLQPDGRLVETYASAAGGFTILLTSPDGTSCMVSSGEGFRLTGVPGEDA
jgi:hypothetical protein